MTHACDLSLWKVQLLGQDIHQLVGVSNANQLHMTTLDHLVINVLPDVNMLCALPTTNDVVSPVYARCVVLIHLSRGRLSKVHVLEDLTKVQIVCCSRPRRIVLCFLR